MGIVQEERRFNTYFRGQNVGVFGGIVYDANENFDMLLEYNPERYDYEVQRGTKPINSPISYGVRWKPIPSLEFTLSQQHNNFTGINLQSNIDTKFVPEKKPFTLIASDTLLNEEYLNSIDQDDWYSKLRSDMSNFGLILYFVELHEGEESATIGVGNKQHLLWADALSMPNKFLICIYLKIF